MHLDDLGALDLASDRLSSALAAIDEAQWALPTPCDEWDVSALVDHVTGGNRFTVSVLRGRSADDAIADAIASFDDGHASAHDAEASLTEQRAAFNRPGALDGTCDHVAGPLPVALVLRLRLHDLIVHTWDLEQSLSPPAEIPALLVRWGLEEMAATGSLEAAGFDPPGDPPPGSDVGRGILNAETPQDRYLGRFGRR